MENRDWHFLFHFTLSNLFDTELWEMTFPQYLKSQKFRINPLDSKKDKKFKIIDKNTNAVIFKGFWPFLNIN